MLLDLLYTHKMHLGMKAGHYKPLTFNNNHLQPQNRHTTAVKSPDKCKFHTFISGQAKRGKQFPCGSTVSKRLEARRQLRHLRMDFIYCSHGPTLAQAGGEACTQTPTNLLAYFSALIQIVVLGKQ